MTQLLGVWWLNADPWIILKIQIIYSKKIPNIEDELHNVIIIRLVLLRTKKNEMKTIVSDNAGRRMERRQ